jgi:hypothetical protein
VSDHSHGVDHFLLPAKCRLPSRSTGSYPDTALGRISAKRALPWTRSRCRFAVNQSTGWASPAISVRPDGIPKRWATRRDLCATSCARRTASGSSIVAKPGAQSSGAVFAREVAALAFNADVHPHARSSAALTPCDRPRAQVTKLAPAQDHRYAATRLLSDGATRPAAHRPLTVSCSGPSPNRRLQRLIAFLPSSIRRHEPKHARHEHADPGWAGMMVRERRR